MEEPFVVGKMRAEVSDAGAVTLQLGSLSGKNFTLSLLPSSLEGIVSLLQDALSGSGKTHKPHGKKSSISKPAPATEPPQSAGYRVYADQNTGIATLAVRDPDGGLSQLPLDPATALRLIERLKEAVGILEGHSGSGLQ